MFYTFKRSRVKKTLRRMKDPPDFQEIVDLLQSMDDVFLSRFSVKRAMRVKVSMHSDHLEMFLRETRKMRECIASRDYMESELPTHTKLISLDDFLTTRDGYTAPVKVVRDQLKENFVVFLDAYQQSGEILQNYYKRRTYRLVMDVRNFLRAAIEGCD